MKMPALHKVIIVAAAVALGSFSIATDALARGGGGGGGHGGGGGGHFGGGGGMHFGGGGGGMHFGGGGVHLGGGGGLHLGGSQFGGVHSGGSHFGGTHIGGAAMARAPSPLAGAHLNGREVGTGLRTASGLQHPHDHDRHRHSRYGFARFYNDAYPYGYDDDTCWAPYRFRLHWRRRWVCG